MRIVLATRNAGKIAELRRILDFDIVGLEAFPEIGDVKETGLTFAANALLKAHAVAQQSGLPAVADDSGLCVDALNGMPGIFSARWSGRHGDDQANLDLLLAQISDVPAEHRGGAFVCAAALALPDGQERVVEGVLRGTVISEPRGSGGFGYDPVFVPEGSERTTAELTAAEKDAISHRGLAFRALVPVVREVLT
ncbi:RdgB/HAM1 family non-canonical purine NTP pyrophosphatase [Nonomuraea soli]|uniref:dITP/XTP pyrophosphatase n=1 Tax=Nonomuraea soli TaxID=1032476 RepID=A0A7W0CL64_9ACTN|nr:RdgB/HAM1 family non-canonical purine NTP pyrophosphatase [Nonomuraea soli]MBA2893160.1 XTP/dITP diphosphohydrolase [Nonomuraea soli]